MIELFSVEDQKKIHTELSNLSPPPLQHRFESVFNRWERLVKHVESGYELTIDDYTNSICSRDILEAVENALSEDGKCIFQGIVAKLDERFKLATREVSKPLMNRSLSLDHLYWWWFRVPIKGSERFFQTIRALIGNPL